jgi:CRP-like cAMP-binding protein
MGRLCTARCRSFRFSLCLAFAAKGRRPESAASDLTVGPLVTKFRNYAPLSSEEEQILDTAVSGVREYEPEQDIVDEGTSPDHSCLLLSGFAARYTMNKEGRRQITALHVAGDFVDLHSFLMKPMDHSIVALSTAV